MSALLKILGESQMKYIWKSSKGAACCDGSKCLCAESVNVPIFGPSDRSSSQKYFKYVFLTLLLTGENLQLTYEFKRHYGLKTSDCPCWRYTWLDYTWLDQFGWIVAVTTKGANFPTHDILTLYLAMKHQNTPSSTFRRKFELFFCKTREGVKGCERI